MICTTDKPIEVLLLEDNAEQARVMKDALKARNVHNAVHIANDEADAMEFLHRRGKYLGAHRPDLIMLDNTLPKKDGFELLAELKADDELCSIPVLVKSWSAAVECLLGEVTRLQHN